MKVAFMFGGMNRGGAETLMLDVFQNHRDADFDMIGIHRKGGVCKDAFYQAGVPLFHIFPQKRLYISYFKRLRMCIMQNGVDVIHTQHWIDCLYAKIATLGLRVLIINTLHGFFDNRRLCRRYSLLSADALCTVSSYEKEWYTKKYKINPEKIHVIYNGINFDKFKNAAIEKLTSPLPLNPNNDGTWPKLAMVGNFNLVRAHKTIVDGITILKRKNIDRFEFYFAGIRTTGLEYLYDDCVKACYEAGLENVHFLGGRDDIPAVLNQMDGFVYSTHNDTFGIAVVEAMGAGLPVIVNDWPVMKEITQNGEWATLFKTGDVEDCASKIQELLNNLEARKAKAKKIAQKVMNEYSIERHISTLNELYNHC